MSRRSTKCPGRSPVLVVALVSLAASASASVRSSVNVFGTTVGPNFSRAEGTLTALCPSLFPFAFALGLRCCKHRYKDSAGAGLRFEDPAEGSCQGDEYVEYEEVHKTNQREGTEGVICTTRRLPVASVTDQTNHNTGFAAEKALDDDCDDRQNSVKNFWSGPQQAAAPGVAYIVLDFGCVFFADKVILRNAVNRNFKDRSTHDFTLKVSLDGTSWTTAVSDVLPDVRSLLCSEMSNQVFDFAHGPLEMRHARFDALTWSPADASNSLGSAASASLAYIEVVPAWTLKLY